MTKIYEQNEGDNIGRRDGDETFSAHGDDLETAFARVQPADDFLSPQCFDKGGNKRHFDDCFAGTFRAISQSARANF